MENYIIGFEPCNEILSKLRIKGRYNNISIINAYAPTEDKTDESKEQFYDDFQNILDSMPKSDITVILGDLNAQLGKEAIYSEVTENYTIHDETNRNGEMCDFAIANNFIIMSTQFQHKQIHKGTWTSPD
jgi:exonuclease III